MSVNTIRDEKTFPPPSRSNLVNINPEEPFLKFPPFPIAPEGTTITPFKEFKEYGIQIFSGDADEEIDGLGIPTVEMRVQHETDNCKTDTKRRKKKKEPETKKKPSVRKTWWELWDEAEDLRLSGPYDPNTSRVDRIYQAASDFRTGRFWPPATIGVSFLWDQFRLYIGLLGIIPIWNRTDRPQQDNDDEDASADDEAELEAEGGEPKIDVVSQPGVRRFPFRLKARPPYAHYGEDPIPIDSDEGVRQLLDEENLRKEERLATFLNDPERGITIFLSSYARDQGLYWTDRYLDIMPRVLGYFVNFLLRNRVLPEVEYERGLRRSLDIIAKAQRELPLIAKVAKVYPDALSLGCIETFGSKAEKPKLAFDDLSDEALGGSVQDVLTDTIDIISDDEIKVEEVVIAEKYEDTLDEWGISDIHSLMPLLGPTSLPLTHTAGIVEVSVRRIKSISLPPTTVPRLPASDGPDADAVEADLQGRFAKVVLSPWINWDIRGDVPDMSNPRILETSRGPVTTEGGHITSANGTGLTKAHNPELDDIMLLADISVLRHMSIGIGLGGTWVQLARTQDLEPDKALRKKKVRSKSKTAPNTYWYLEKLEISIPSFWTSAEHALPRA